MRKKAIKMKDRLYYIGLNKASNSVTISITKTGIAEFLGISTITILRHMRKSVVYDTDDYTIWKNVHIKELKRGWTYNHTTNRHSGY